MKYLKLFESFLSDYAEKEFDTTKINSEENVGTLYHCTSISRAISILKEKYIQTANVVFDNGIYKYKPWFKQEEYKEDLYGNFVYTSKDSEGFWGVGDCDVMFCINGDLLKKIRNIYKANDPKIEGHLHMIEGSVPIYCVFELYCWQDKHINELKNLTNIKIIKRND